MLEELFGDRLWQHGITCMTMFGSTSGKEIPRVGTLLAQILGFSKARNAVWFDGIRDSIRQQLTSAPEGAAGLMTDIAEQLKAGSGDARKEERDACELAIAADKASQPILVLSHPMADVWDLLDPGSIEAVAHQLGVGNYVHQEVKARWEAAEKSGKRRKSQRKWSFLRDEIGLDPSLKTITSICREMKTRGVAPHAELESVVWECECLSLEPTQGPAD